MTPCSCVYVDSADSYPEFHHVSTPTARKWHTCCECGRIIISGERYEYVVGLWDNQFSIYKTCLDCLSIRDEFFCEGWFYSSMKEYLYEHIREMRGQISEDCLSVLTPGGRAIVCDMIENEWKD